MISLCSTAKPKNLQLIEEAINRVKVSIASTSEKISYLKSGKGKTEQQLTREQVHQGIEEKRDLEIFLNDQEQKIKQLELLKHFSPGMWVCRNNTKTPQAGIIVDICLDNDFPYLVVKYDLQKKLINELPINLRKCSQEELAYTWHEFKIIRKLDRFECLDVQIIQTFLAESELNLKRGELVRQSKTSRDRYKREIAYCKNRLQTITGKAKQQGQKISQITDKQQQMLLNLFGEERQETKLKTLPIANIKCDPSCQQREELNIEVVEEYTSVLKNGGKLPSVKVKFDGTDYWLYDGFHTIAAAKEASLTEIGVEFSKGSLRDAILASVGVNANHGLRRSNQTKRNAVMTLLQDEEWCRWSDREIAKRCSVSNTFVSNLRKNLTVNVDSDQPKEKENLTVNVDSDKEDNTRKYINKHGTESTMKVENIGQSNPLSQSEQSIEPEPTSHAVCETFKKGVSSSSTKINNEFFPLSKSTVAQIEFFPNQLLRLNLSSFDGVSPKLKLRNHHYCVITSKTEIGNGYNVKFFEGSAMNSSFVVKAEDLEVVSVASLTLNFSPAEYMELLSIYGGLAGIESAAQKMFKGVIKVEVTSNR